MSEDLREIWQSGASVAELNRLLQLIPYARLLSLSAEFDDRGLLILMAKSDRLIGNPVLRALHGGAIGALLESTAVCGVMWQSQLTLVPKTISITIDYLRSGRVEETRARASITKLGRRVASVAVEAFQADESKPIASARTHLLLRE